MTINKKPNRCQFVGICPLEYNGLQIQLCRDQNVDESEMFFVSIRILYQAIPIHGYSSCRYLHTYV